MEPIKTARPAMAPWAKWGMMIVLTVGFAGFINSCISASKGPSDGYSYASSNMWSGVKVYYRDKAPAFVILGGSDNHTFPNGKTARAIQVLTPEGKIEWRNRDDMVKAYDYWLVKNDDPALSAQQWKVINE